MKKCIGKYKYFILMIIVIPLIFLSIGLKKQDEKIQRYYASVLIELGQGIGLTRSKLNVLFDKPYDIKPILVSQFPFIEVSIPKRSTKLIKLKVIGTDKKVISDKINKVIKFIKQRHTNMLIFYSNKYIMTKQIGRIKIQSITHNNKLIWIRSLTAFLFIVIFLLLFIKFKCKVYFLEKHID